MVALVLLVGGMGIEVAKDALVERDEPIPPPEEPGDFRFVALGDSYISGEGAEVFYEGTNEPTNRCRRAPTSYPYFIGRFIGVTPVSAACSGARTFNILNVPQYPKSPPAVFGGEPQIDVLERTTDVDVVLLSIGGNDAGFAEIGVRCSHPLKGPCVSKEEEWLRRLEVVEDRLVSVYTAVGAAAPEAEVFVVNYPNPFGEKYCRAVPTINRGEYEFLSERFIPALNATIDRAAAAAGVAVIDVAEAFTRWRLCEVEPREAAINILAISRTGTRGSFHPTELGHTLIARNVGKIVAQVWLESSPRPEEMAGAP
ncbi:MAG: SGNH/GDSL hydrolase family protein [Actinomycetota bacterium]